MGVESVKTLRRSIHPLALPLSAVGYASRTITPARHLMIAMDPRSHRRENASLGVWIIIMSCAEKGTRCVPYIEIEINKRAPREVLESL